METVSIKGSNCGWWCELLLQRLLLRAYYLYVNFLLLCL